MRRSADADMISHREREDSMTPNANHLEARFHQRMLRVHREAVAEGLISASSPFNTMVQTHGAREAVNRLLANPEPQPGLFGLWEDDPDGTQGYYKYTCEYVILHEGEWGPLFEQWQRQRAYDKLHAVWPNVDFPGV
jgi:hypothetical protein